MVYIKRRSIKRREGDIFDHNKLKASAAGSDRI